MLLYAPLLFAAQAAPVRVAVEQGSTSNGTAADVVAQLNDDTYHDFTATQVAAEDIDSAAELASYDVVVFGDSGNNNNDWTQEMADALVVWVTAGKGGVVSTGWVDYAITSATPYGETIDQVMPIDAYPDGNNEFCGQTGLRLVVDSSVSHPVTAGVATFDDASADIEISPFAPDATNGRVLATAEGACTQSPANAVVVGELGAGRTVYLGPLYLGSASYNVGGLRSGDADRLFEQAVFWTAPVQDADEDGVADDDDNCPDVANTDQADADADTLGDACDECTDVDEDGYGDTSYDATTCEADCDDDDDTVYPGAPELADGKDNDCDGVDETVDTDNDGLTDEEEQALGTKPDDPDTDGGGVSDGDEVNRDGTDPLDPDDDLVDTGDTDDTDDDDDGVSGGCACNGAPVGGSLALLPMLGLLFLRRRRG
jgi:hypothetical protein